MVLKGMAAIFRSSAVCMAVTTGLVAGPSAHAQSVARPGVAFDIPAGSLQSALAAFAKQSGMQLIYAPEAVAGRRVGALKARLSPNAALRKLLANSGLVIRQVNAKVIMIEPRRSVPRTSSNSIGTRNGATPEEETRKSQSDFWANEDIIVTGSHIRGQAPVGSHVRTIDRDEIDRNGYSTVAELLQGLPGNFGGTATEQSALSLADRTGTNSTLSTGVNLRGLGAAATLVLVNGRRIAGAGSLGDFADVSNIPMSLVKRVEVLMDGASAIYGSDAVGGVINVVMKDHVEGFETAARFGTVTQGGLREFQISQTAGTNWGSGSVLLSYEYYRRTALNAADRRFARSADLRSLGGTDHRYIYSLPGNILGTDRVTGGLVVTHAVPTGQDGTDLEPGDFIAGGTNLENFRRGVDLSPQQKRHSLYAHIGQDIVDKVHLSVEGRYTRRNFESRSSGYPTILTITDANPWFVSPTGASSDLIGYSFGREAGPTRDSGWSDTIGLVAGVDVDLPAGWKLSAYGAYARSKELHLTDNLPNEAIIAEALGTAPDDPATTYSPSRDGYFNPYGDGGANSPVVLAAIASGFNESRNANHITTGNVQADGPLFDLPAGTVRMALGTNIRREYYESRYTSFFVTATPRVRNPVERGRTISAAFGELRIPLFGSGNARPGLRRLELSLAGRIEHYPDFGMTANPKLGLSWSPAAGVMFRGTYGTSFRAPNLGQLRDASGVSSTILTNADGVPVRVLQLSGGNPDLEPERARSWTIGAEIAPSALPGFHVNVTLFRTIFDRRIDRPAARGFRNALTDTSLAPFVRFVAPATNAADRDYVQTLLDAMVGGGTSFPVDSIAAVVDTRYVNTASTDVRGIDLMIGYTAKRGANTFSIDGNATWLLAFEERNTPTSPAVDQRNIAGRPVGFRGRVTAGWRRGGFDALLGVNYVDRYREAITGARIGAWTTVDARIAWNSPAESWLGDTSIALVARNLFDRDPPFYDSPAGLGYDATNSDAIGRLVSLQITKRW
ncbi:TonB-dependent receptor [Sphingopyxis sp. MG]|uniref:TonB-dependent receptor n=1 Tax=Sphingopyxis sp. MG TaxID=1866325 RepID=UPI001F298BE1|nr:TonB-dependent receptor [Sphingopyxis sp. MG]